MSEAEEAACPLKAMKLNKKATEDEINTFKQYFKEYFSACCTNYFTGMETCVIVQHRRHKKCSRMKELFDVANLSSVEESMSKFAASDKKTKGQAHE